MRSTRTLIATLILGLTATASARGGVYNPLEPLPWPLPAENFHAFRDLLGQLQTIRIPAEERPVEPGSLRARYLGMIPTLEAKRRAGDLSLDERVALSAAYLRQGKAEEAASLLEEVPRAQRNYLVLANLASAHHQAGRLERAVAYQQEVLKAWPAAETRYTAQQLAWLARAEKHYLKLLRQRYQESLRAPSKPWETVDALFPGVQFVGPSGEYEAGQMAVEYRTELPPDAVQLVVQLLLWLPYDDRLYWLLGELLNAQAEILPAEKVLHELVNARGNSRVRQLREHRKVLVEARQLAEELSKPANVAMLAWMAAPHGGLQGPGIGSAAYEGAWAALVSGLPKQLSELDGGSSVPPAPAPSVRPDWLPDWRHLAVGFIAGAIVMLLVQLQWRESRRRRQGVVAAPRG